MQVFIASSVVSLKVLCDLSASGIKPLIINRPVLISAMVWQKLPFVIHYYLYSFFVDFCFVAKVVSYIEFGSFIACLALSNIQSIVNDGSSPYVLSK